MLDICKYCYPKNNNNKKKTNNENQCMCCKALPVLTSQCLQPPEETALWMKQHLLPHSLREKHGLLVNSTKYAVPVAL